MLFTPADLFDLNQTEHAALFAGCEYAWDALKHLGEYLAGHLRPKLHNHCDGVAWIGKRVFIGEGTEVEDGAMIQGPAIIGRNCRIAHNAYIRHNVIVGDHCIVGNACEIKHSLLFNHCEVPHFSYVGDSILGAHAHLGAGAQISNLKLLPGNVMVEVEGRPFDTGLEKFGALIGDGAQIGCNAVLNPGAIVGRKSVIYPGLNWRGILPERMIAKNTAPFVVAPRRPPAEELSAELQRRWSK